MLIRQLSKKRLNTEDKDRPEWAAIRKLYPDKSVEEVAFEVFTAPEGTGTAKERTEHAREAAWQLLTHWTKTARRRAFLASMAENPAPGDGRRARATANDLGVVPLTASEVAWIRQLRRADNAQWWAQAKAAIATLPSGAREGLAVRHAEPVRWAALNEPSWLTMSREELVTMLGAKLKGRELFLRSDGGANVGSERLVDNIKYIVWGDVLALLAIDVAIHTPGMVDRLIVQADEDAAEANNTEYGGYISIKATDPGWHTLHRQPLPAAPDAAFQRHAICRQRRPAHQQRRRNRPARLPLPRPEGRQRRIRRPPRGRHRLRPRLRPPLRRLHAGPQGRVRCRRLLWQPRPLRPGRRWASGTHDSATSGSR